MFPQRRFKKASKDHKYAIIIPARNESAVIRDLLESIKAQTYNKDLLHTYIVVENQFDQTCDIAKEYKNTEVFVRPDIVKKCKGGALDQIFKKLLADDLGYDAYFIFDADNVMNVNFVSEMNKTFDAGYDIAMGYRNSKNWNSGFVAACGATQFSIINTCHNKARAKLGMNIVFSGTGLYVSHKIISDLGGWPFFTITEDYEMSVWATLHNVKTTYNEHAEFFDDQAAKFRTSWNQRTRWLHGFHQARYLRKNVAREIFTSQTNIASKIDIGLNVTPLVVVIVTAVLYIAALLSLGIAGVCMNQPNVWEAFDGAVWASVAAYLAFVLYTAYAVICEWWRINLKFFNALVLVLFSPFWYMLYIPLYFSLPSAKKRMEWKPVDRNIEYQRKKHTTKIVIDVEVDDEDKKEKENKIKI